jgi:hypothetical protein
MLTRYAFNFTSALLLGGTLGAATACSTESSEPEASAINLKTGEQRSFPKGHSPPTGWALCEPECPALTPCTALAEAACLARQDCQPGYAEFWPPECDNPNAPAYCAALPFVACGSRPTNACNDSGCGSTDPMGTEPGSIDPDPAEPSRTPPTPEPGDCSAVPNCAVACPDDENIVVCGVTCPVGTRHPVDGNGCLETCVCMWDAAACSTLPQCDLVCPAGTHHPLHENGCENSCSCVPDPDPEDCSQFAGCEFPCPIGSHNPVDENGCGHTCECVLDDACITIPQCEFLCLDGTRNPVDENGCLHTCECVADTP